MHLLSIPNFFCLCPRLDSPLRVKYAVALENFCNDRDSGIDRVGDNKNECLGSILCDARGKISDDPCIDLYDHSQAINSGIASRLALNRSSLLVSN